MCANFQVLMGLLLCELCLWVRKNESELNRHTNPFLYPLSDCFSSRCFFHSEEEEEEEG